MACCDGKSQEVLGFSNVIASGNPTPYFEPIVSTASPTLTPFGDSDFLLFEEADSFLALEDDPTSSELNLPFCEPPEVELKELPPHLEYAFLEGDDKLPVIIAKDLKDEEKAALLKVLKSHKRAIAWKLSDIKGVSPEFCTHKILMEEDYEPSVQSSLSKALGLAGTLCTKKEAMTVITNDEKELIPTSIGHGDRRIPIDPKDQEKTTFTCPYGTFAYRRMPFGLCNAPGTFQRCMMAIFHDMIEKTMEVFRMTFRYSGGTLSSTLLSYLEKMLKRCEDHHLSLNWERRAFLWRPSSQLPLICGESRGLIRRTIICPDLKNPHQTIENKEINEAFPLETLVLLALQDQSDKSLCFWAKKTLGDLLKACHMDPLGGHYGAIYHSKERRSPWTNKFGGRVKRRDPKQALRGRHTPCLSDFPDCEDSRAHSIHMSFTSSA
ncbi:hypothetical protein Tco_0922293 [Tanacetum coccineum]|uniref:Reverse transcriptase domain-containing protein n=1 Tax=Tanacetum coccineum TaxID=301880 RepID=A0ABQ5D457_9ASTR